MSTNQQSNAIILFDGVCNLCNGAVQFIIKRDPKAYFKFASLQSEVGQQLLKKHDLPTKSMDTIVLIEQGQAYIYSSAPLRICHHLAFPWPLATAFLLVPPFIRHAVYRWVGNNRYKWFGKQEECMLPSPEDRARFLS